MTDKARSSAATCGHGWGDCCCPDCCEDAARRAEEAASKPAAGAKPDELALWAALEAGESPRDAGQRLAIPPNRVEYLCLKWARHGIYDYGVVHDLGWISRV